VTPLVHRALMYGSREDLLSVTVPFLREGLESDDAILAVVPAVTIEALRDTLGRDADAMLFMDAGTWYQHPVRTIAAYNDFANASAPRRVRALAEPAWHGRSPCETVEWQRYESIVNVAFTGFVAQVICLYDHRRLSPEVLSAARSTHPEVVGGHDVEDGDGFVDPAVFNARCDRHPLAPAKAAVESRAIETEDGLHDLRAFVAGHAEHRRMAPEPLGNLLMAVTEVATNALRHGKSPATLRMWAEETDLVCEVADQGHWDRDPLTGFVPPASAAAAGFGLWGARMLVDLVQVRTGTGGTVVRLRTRFETRARTPL
jgi:anti-sigma regulatory factor (Ser/Thr protein kinase)